MFRKVRYEILCEKARQALKKKKYRRAVKLYQKALKADEQADLLQELAVACFLAKRYDDAIRHYKRLMRLTPDDPNPLISLGAVYNRISRFEDALNVLRRATTMAPDSADVYYNMAIAHRRLNQKSMAVAAYCQATRLDPELADAHLNLANLYLDLGDNIKAVEHYKRALEIRPDFERAKKGFELAEAAIAQRETEVAPFGRLAGATDVDEL